MLELLHRHEHFLRCAQPPGLSVWHLLHLRGLQHRRLEDGESRSEYQCQWNEHDDDQRQHVLQQRELSMRRVSLSDSGGFTLVEVVVAMSIGIIVLLAAFAVTDRSWQASKRVSDREDALQRGRIALELMTRELHSMTCAGQNAPVTLAKDDQVAFYAYMGDPTTGSTNPVRHVLAYSSS